MAPVALAGLRVSAQQLREGDRVRFVGHIMHGAPPILKGESDATGVIEDGGYGDLYRMRLDKTGTTVQIHAMQVERVDGHGQPDGER
jgi:hypothetical protein